MLSTKTLAKKFGIQVNKERLICGECGFGKRGEFFPVLDDSECPECGNRAGHSSLQEFLRGLHRRDFWYVAKDRCGSFHVAHVKVIRVTDPHVTCRLTLREEDDYGGARYYSIGNAALLYDSKKEAERAIFLEAQRKEYNERRGVGDEVY